MRIAIAGAGIGGLTLALSLEAAGFRDVTVYERARELRGLGVGLNLLPHAMRELTELGLDGRVAALGVPPTTLAYYNRFGQPIWSEPRGRAAGYQWPQLSVHRGRLQLLLQAEGACGGFQPVGRAHEQGIVEGFPQPAERFADGRLAQMQATGRPAAVSFFQQNLQDYQ